MQGQQGQHVNLLRSLKSWLTDLALADKQPQLLAIIAEMEIRYRNAGIVTGVYMHDTYTCGWSCFKTWMHCCRYDSAAPTQGPTAECGLFVIGYAIAKLRLLPLLHFDQANMLAMREALAEECLGLGMVLMLVYVCPILQHTTVAMLCDRYQSTVEVYVAADFLLSSYLSFAMPAVQLPKQHASSNCLVICSPVRDLTWSS